MQYGHSATGTAAYLMTSKSQLVLAIRAPSGYCIFKIKQNMIQNTTLPLFIFLKKYEYVNVFILSVPISAAYKKPVAGKVCCCGHW